jgi:hypothetical protein
VNSMDSINYTPTFTRQGSQVQSLYRPPQISIVFKRLLAFLSATKKPWGQTGDKVGLSPLSTHVLSRTAMTGRYTSYHAPSRPRGQYRDVVMKITAVLLAAIFAVSGCATCHEHPVACTIVGAIVVGSIAATIENNQPDHRQPDGYHPLCAPNCLISGK